MSRFGVWNLVAVFSVLFLVVAVGETFAFSCPALIKEANESIAKAEVAAGKQTGDRGKGRAMAMVAEAKDLVKQADTDHREAGAKKDAQLHYKAEAKAKAAKALAEMVQ